MQVSELIAQLTGPTVSPDDARRPEAAGGAPTEYGLYAWWMTPGAIPGVSGPRHPSEPRELLYIGIAPGREGSTATLHSRICKQHLGGNIGSSTFRLSLAALLVEQQGWRPVWRGDRPRLTREDNAALSAWQRQHLRLCWAPRARPREVEDAVIRELQPPLNLAGNREHPFYKTLKRGRQELRARAAQPPPT